MRYEIRGAFDQTFRGGVTPDGLDIQNFKDSRVDYLEGLKVVVRAGGGKSRSSKSLHEKTLPVQDRPYHDKQDYHSKDLRIEPQVEQWVAWGNIHLIDLTSFEFY